MSPAELVEEIAQRIEAAGRDPHLNLAWMYPNEAAALVRSFFDDFTEDEPADRDCHVPVKDGQLHEGWRIEHGEAVRVR